MPDPSPILGFREPESAEIESGDSKQTLLTHVFLDREVVDAWRASIDE